MCPELGGRGHPLGRGTCTQEPAKSLLIGGAGGEEERWPRVTPSSGACLYPGIGDLSRLRKAGVRGRRREKRLLHRRPLAVCSKLPKTGRKQRPVPTHPLTLNRDMCVCYSPFQLQQMEPQRLREGKCFA